MKLQHGLRVGLIAAMAVMVGGGAVAQDATLAPLKAIEAGQWQLRESGSGGSLRSMCVADREALLRLRHPNDRCTQFVIENKPRTATIHYTCPGAGHGRTTIDLVTPRSIVIETQGIAGGAPFHANITAKRTGACGPAARAR